MSTETSVRLRYFAVDCLISIVIIYVIVVIKNVQVVHNCFFVSYCGSPVDRNVNLSHARTASVCMCSAG